jgi:hypothetical protein
MRTASHIAYLSILAFPAKCRYTKKKKNAAGVSPPAVVDMIMRLHRQIPHDQQARDRPSGK